MNGIGNLSKIVHTIYYCIFAFVSYLYLKHNGMTHFKGEKSSVLKSHSLLLMYNTLVDLYFASMLNSLNLLIKKSFDMMLGKL